MKASRLALLTTAQLCWAALVSPALAGGMPAIWTDLWRTPDQQGQALLDAGKPAEAAARFSDPRRRAYADLEAGHDREAAKLLAPFTDAESEYNRGNALAGSGQLRSALAAYDAALKQDPTDKDIRHNRDVVERALRHQSRSPRSAGGSRRQGGQGRPSSGQQQPRQSGARGSQSAGGGRTASNGSQAGAGHPGNSGQQTASPRAGEHGSRSRHSPGQARRDAAFAAALARAQGHRGGSRKTGRTQGSQGNGTSNVGRKGEGKPPESGRRLAGGTRTPRQKPETEQQLALQQWLRQIPDSPAGLLRRKFLIEHMLKQQDGQEPQGDGP